MSRQQNSIIINSLLSYSKWNMSMSIYALCQPLSTTPQPPLSTVEDSWLSHFLYSVTFSWQTLFWLLLKLLKSFADVIAQGLKSGEIDGDCCLWVSCRQFTCWVTYRCAVTCRDWEKTYGLPSLSWSNLQKSWPVKEKPKLMVKM